MSRKKFIYITIWVLFLPFLLSGCYKEQHFDMPGTVDVENNSDIDSMPFPFDATHQAGEYLIKDGKVDFSRVSFMGFTDFVPTIGGDTLSWYQGEGFYGNLQHYVFYPTNATQFGGVSYSSECNQVYFKPFLEIGPGKKWYFYAKMSVEYLNNTTVLFWFGGAEGYSKRAMAGLDWGTMSLFYGMVNGNRLSNYESWPTCPELLMPGKMFEVELACVDCFVYFKVNGKLLWFYNLPADAHSMPLSLQPNRNSVKLYDVYIEGDYEELNPVAWRQEETYTTVQRPALTRNGGEVWLFAEGRVNNCALTTNVKARRSNATDIVMKRSADGGNTWSGLNLIAGNKQAVNIRPEVVTGSNHVTHLFYTIDRSGLLDGNYEIYTTNSNNGSSWSAHRKIVTGLSADYQISTVSGHGLETRGGRLIIPVYCTKTNEKNMAVLYSDDQGTTWKSGNVIPGETDAANGNIVELSDGRLMLIIGQSSGSLNYRRFSYSTDGGENWSEPVPSSLIFANAYGPRFQGATVMRDGKLVHFSPSNRIQGSTYNGDGRRIYQAPDFALDLITDVSANDGKDWNEGGSMFPLKAFQGYNFLTGYMDAVVLDDGRVLCVTEGGAVVPYEGLIRFIYP